MTDAEREEHPAAWLLALVRFVRDESVNPANRRTCQALLESVPPEIRVAATP